MSGILYLLDAQRLIDKNGVSAGGKIYFYYTGTAVLAPIFTDENLTIPAANPLVASADGSLPRVFLNSTITYRRYIVYEDGSTDNADPYVAGGSSVLNSLGNSTTSPPSQAAVTIALGRIAFPDIDTLLVTTLPAGGVGTQWQAGDTVWTEVDPSTPMFDPVTAPTGAVLQLPSGQRLQISGQPNEAHFGMSVNSADNSSALQKAWSWLFCQSDRPISFGPGQFNCLSRVSYTQPVSMRNFKIQGNGTTINFAAGGGIDLFVSGTALVRNIEIKDLRLTGGSTLLYLKAPLSTNFLYNISLDNVAVDNFTADGIRLEGNVFETVIRHCSGAAQSNTTGVGLHLLNGSLGGVISSIDIFGGTWRGGLYCLSADSPVNDLRIYGGTYLFAQREGIFIANAIGTSIFGTHVEGNWMSAGSLAAGGGGVTMNGYGTIIGVVGVCNNTQFQQYAVNVFASTGGITIQGGNMFGTGVKYGKYNQSATGEIVLIGNIVNNFDGTAVPTILGKVVTPVQGVMKENFLAYNASRTFDLSLGTFCRIGTLTGNVAIGAPTNLFGGTGTEIIVQVQQDATGSRTVTWDPSFFVSNAVDAAANKFSFWRFVRVSSGWRQTAFSSTF